MLKRIVLSAVMMLVLTAAVSQAEVWKVDNAHSYVGFEVKHLVISTVKGNFKDFAGTINFDGKDVSKGSAELTIQVASINTNQEKRDGHLKSADFFAADSFPTITFKSKKVIPGTDQAFKLVGDFTMRGVTKEVTFDCVFGGVFTSEKMGGSRAGFSAEAVINRQDFKLSYGQVLDNGGLAVGNDVKIKIDLEAVKAK